MNIINRVKNILTKPKEEWQVINAESTTGKNLAMSYLLPLAIVAAAAVFIGFGFIIDFASVKFALVIAIVFFLQLVLSIYITGYVADALSPSFGSEKNVNKSLQLVIYASTPFLVGHALYIFPSIGWLGLLAGGIYSLYLLFLGIPALKKTPEDKVPIYLIVIVVVLALAYWLIRYIAARIIISSIFDLPFGYYGGGF
jgi:hypothetical protein